MILVFGKTGQLAQALAHFDGVKCLGRADADLSHPLDCAAIIQDLNPVGVINAAAYTDVNGAETHEDMATVVNGAAPTAMAHSCAQLGIPFVHVSTDYVFDGSGELPRKIDDPVGPLNAYGRSKLVGENGIQRAGGAFVILRTSWVYSGKGQNFLTTVVRLSATLEQMDVVADQFGGPTAATDLASACYGALQGLMRDASTAGVYHFAGVPLVNWAEFAEAIVVAGELPMTINRITAEAFNAPVNRPMNSRMDCDTFVRIFDHPLPDWRRDLAQVVRDAGGG